MFRIVSASAIASVIAHRIQHNNELNDVNSGDQSKLQSDFGASCDDLEVMFRSKVTAFQDALDAHPDLNAIGRTTQARLLMKSYGVLRTLRRARDCSWVAENNGDMEQMRGIVQTLIAGNPCAEAARAECSQGRVLEIDMGCMQRSMSILMSENCEVMEVPEEQVEPTSVDLDAQLSEAEADLQDNIDEFADASERESGGAFIQSDARTLRGLMRGLSVAFVFMFLLLACAGTAAIIGMFLTYGVIGLVLQTFPSLLRRVPDYQGFGSWWLIIVSLYGGGALGGGVGLATCSYQFYTRLLPRLSQ